MNKIRLSVIIPTFNEKKNIVRLIEKIQGVIPPSHEIIIVDDQSTDKTGKLIDEFISSPKTPARRAGRFKKIITKKDMNNHVQIDLKLIFKIGDHREGFIFSFSHFLRLSSSCKKFFIENLFNVTTEPHKWKRLIQINAQI